VTASTNPTVRRRQLGIELRRLREAAGLTLEEVGLRLEWSRSKVSRIETGQVSLRVRDVEDLCEVLGASKEKARELAALVRNSRQRSWWQKYSDVMPAAFGTYVALEEAAGRVQTYQTELIDGLLQTEQYARAVFEAWMPPHQPDDVERLVQLRMTRQQRLRSKDPLAVWAIINEAALRRVVGGPKVMADQLEHLVKLLKLPNLDIQVLPFTAGAHAAMNGPFLILSFPEINDLDVVHLEHQAGSTFLEEPADLKRFGLQFDHLRAQALDLPESAKTLKTIMAEYATWTTQPD